MKQNIIKGSMMRYLTLWAFRIGAFIAGYSLAILTWCFIISAMEWAGTFITTFMSGITLMSAGIAGKGFQKKYENGKENPYISDDYKEKLENSMKGQMG